MMEGGELVYGSDQEYDNIATSSEPVQGLATSVYKEFEKMIANYDQDVVRDLMPLVVTMLETLDQTITERNESAVEIELLEEDKKQLKSQFERERQQKRLAEQRLIENEDVAEALSRDLKQLNEKFEVTSRQLEMKCKSQADQIERLLDREMELKKEYTELHQRHSEMIRSYVEHIEKTKTLQQHLTPDSISYSPIPKKHLPDSFATISPLSPETPSSRQLDSTPVQENSEPIEAARTRRLEWQEGIDPFHPNIKQEIIETINKEDALSKEEKLENLPIVKEDLNSDRTSLESNSSGLDSGNLLSHEFQQSVLKMGLNVDASTPLHGEGDASSLTRHQQSLGKIGIENEAFEHGVTANHESLYIEMCDKDLGDVDDGADILGMGKELENLMLENTKLMATKNALDIVKDDLIHQVDQLTNQLTMIQEDLERAHQSKEILSRQVSELQTEVKRLEKINKEAGNSPSGQTPVTPIGEDDLTSAQRKRFTRVEMSRVLMERNQYKERLMELQEAVRWTEMLRASRDHPAEWMPPPSKEKSGSSISRFFSRLFGPSTSTTSSANVSPSRQRMKKSSSSSVAEDAKMRHSLSDSFTTAQSNMGK
ncbi:C-Jun-amino-terminal kinase-interacting protein 4-like [Styela clava]